MKIEFARRALREILWEARWWVENRPDAPLLFEEELKGALERICKAPEAPKVYRVKRGRATAARVGAAGATAPSGTAPEAGSFERAGSSLRESWRRARIAR